jgi:hypothetical protein
MGKSIDRLYELLPSVYRAKDAEQGYALQALLRVIAREVDVVEDDIAQLYENWFIETCQDWIVPYIGDLIGYQIVHEAGEPGHVTTQRELIRNKILIPRREVANTIRFRRRKGTLALLEVLANDVAGWFARAVEFYKLLGWTQHLNHLQLLRGQTVDLRNGRALGHVDDPFDSLGHTVDVRRIVSHRTQGRYNIPSVGLFVWRLKTYSVTQTPAYCLEEIGPHCYTFSVLGNVTPLYNRPQPETEPTHIADELNLPIPISRAAFEKRIIVDRRFERTEASDKYYDERTQVPDKERKSVTIWATDWPSEGASQPIPAGLIIPADLSNWQYHAPRNFVAVDPGLGRIVFPTGQLPKHGVTVSYLYAFSADIGGGEYNRSLSQPAINKPNEAGLYRVGTRGDYGTIKDALAQWNKEEPKPPSAVIEITDSGEYTEQLNINLKKNETLQIRASNHTRPVIRLLDWKTELPDSLSVKGKAGSRFIIDGLLIAGRGVLVDGTREYVKNSESKDEGDLCAVVIRHCTLVPGWSLHHDCEPKSPSEPSLELVNTHAHIKIEDSIIGSIQVVADEVKTDPLQIEITDSILDATNASRVALGAPNLSLAYAVLTIARCTVIGEIHTHAIALAENCIFAGIVRVARRQQGCMRFCYVTPGSRTPRRYECQPDLVEQAVLDLVKKDNLSTTERDSLLTRERLRVEPEYNSTRYGTPTYCQLADTCAAEITRGADDESEMGVFHDLYQPQRAANLRVRLDEYTPAGMNAGIIYAS